MFSATVKGSAAERAEVRVLEASLAARSVPASDENVAPWEAYFEYALLPVFTMPDFPLLVL
jgi:hypothetical protein